MSLGYFLLAFMFNRYSALSFKYLNNRKLLMFYVKFDFKKIEFSEQENCWYDIACKRVQLRNIKLTNFIAMKQEINKS